MIIANYIGAVVLICLGLYTILIKRNLIKIVMGMCLMDYGVNLLIVSIGFNPGGTAGRVLCGSDTSGSDADIYCDWCLRGSHGAFHCHKN